METISRFLLVFLINAFWQTLVIALMAWLCDRIMRKAPARYRHWLWVTALFICLALPIYVVTGIGGSAAPSASSAEMAHGEKETVEGLVSRGGVRDIWGGNFWSIKPAPLTPAPVLMFAIVSFYLLSLFFHLAMFLRAWRRTHEIRIDTYEREIPPGIAQVAARCRSAFTIGEIPIFSSVSATSPLTLGIFRPIVILPESLFDSTSTETLISALGHETAHIKRRDFALNLIYESLCLPIAFHPAVALIKRRINQTRELACDEMVTDRLLDARAYARSLVGLAALAPNLNRPIHSYYQPLGVLDADILEERVMNLIEKKPRLSAKRAAALLIATSLALIFSGVASSAFSLSLAQDKGTRPNFSGKWKSETTTNENGELPFPPGYKGETMEIEHNDPEMKVIHILEAEKQWVGERRYNLDGNEGAMIFTIDGKKMTARSKGDWVGKQLIITQLSEAKIETKETWALDDDQKTLTLTREFMGAKGKTIFKKQ